MWVQEGMAQVHKVRGHVKAMVSKGHIRDHPKWGRRARIRRRYQKAEGVCKGRQKCPVGNNKEYGTPGGTVRSWQQNLAW